MGLSILVHSGFRWVAPHSFQSGNPDSKGTGCIAERRAALHGTPAEDGTGHGDHGKRHAAVALGVVNTASRFGITDSDRAMAVSLSRTGVNAAYRTYVS